MDQPEDSIDGIDEDLIRNLDDVVDLYIPTQEVVEDFTGETEEIDVNAPFLSPLTDGGKPKVTPRAYQLEMLDESLKQNTVVAVCLCPFMREDRS